MNHIVVAGAGHAGVQLAESLRMEGITTPITLISNEEGLPYQRPPLSKDHLAAGSTPTRLPLKARKFFIDNNITLRENDPIVSIDRTAQSVRLASRDAVAYSELVLATGAQNRALTVPGMDLNGVHYLRTLDDATHLYGDLSRARTAVVVGAGFIGLEFAAAARARGLDVTVIEYGERPMARALSEQMSQYFTDAHESAGIQMVFGETVTALDGENSRVRAVVGRTGECYPADIVVIGIGVEPNTKIAAAAGLATIYGVSVDSYLRTEDAHVWAIGDCAYFPCRFSESSIRRESVQNAVDQARTLACTLSGNPTEYDEVPWFWSRQGSLKLQIAGILPQSDTSTIHGDLAAGKFSIYHFRNEKLSCVESLNSPAVHLAARRLLASNFVLSPAELTAPGFDLRNFTKRVSPP